MPSRLPAIGSFGISKPVNSVTVSGILRSRGSIDHCPSSTRGSQPVASAAAYATCSPTTARSSPVRGSTIVVRGCAIAGARIDDRQRAMKFAGELVQHADCQHAALAVPDQHRLEAGPLVVECKRTCQCRAVSKTIVRRAAVGGIAQALFGIAHADQELRERLHRDDGDAALQQHDPRRRDQRQDLAYLGGAYAFAVDGGQSRDRGRRHVGRRVRGAATRSRTVRRPRAPARRHTRPRAAATDSRGRVDHELRAAPRGTKRPVRSTYRR